MNPIQKALTRLERGILAAVKETMQRLPEELSVYAFDHLRSSEESASDVLRITAKGNRYFKKPNKTKKLRSLYGNIERSLTVGGKGNYSEVDIKGGLITGSFGYFPDTSVESGTRTQTLKYAVINENKGRPFLTPGFNDYLKDAQGFKALMRELEAQILELA